MAVRFSVAFVVARPAMRAADCWAYLAKTHRGNWYWTTRMGEAHRFSERRGAEGSAEYHRRGGRPISVITVPS